MDINSKKAIIMMATYNGEKYIQDQIKSLQNQTFINWELYISDDNSTDKTVSIIKNLQKKDSRIKKIINNNSQYHGAYANYFNIMYYVKKYCKPYDYYFYCDQDDVWLKDKIQKEVIALIQLEKKYTSSVPAFVYCDLELCNSKCVPINHKMSNHIITQFVYNPYNTFFKEQYVWGTSMAHNFTLWNLMYIEMPEKVKNWVSHDGYVSRYAAVYGKITYINEPLILYRRTGNNVSDVPGKYNILKQKILKLPSVVNNAANVYWDTLYFAYHVPHENKVIRDIKNCFIDPIHSFKYMKKYHILKKSSFFGKLSTKVILYTRIYKYTNLFKVEKYTK